MRLKTAPILILLTGLLAAAAWPRPEENPDQLSESEAMGMMRTINTLEVSISAAYERGFLSLAELASQYHEQSHEQWLSTVVLKDKIQGH